MTIKLSTGDYHITFEESIAEGYGSFILHHRKEGSENWFVAAKMIYWDALGQYHISIFAKELPWNIVDVLVREAVEKTGVPLSVLEKETYDPYL
jgi:hypothetical protein